MVRGVMKYDILLLGGDSVCQLMPLTKEVIHHR